MKNVEELKKDAAKGIAGYIWQEVLMPNGKTMVYETIRGLLSGLDQAIQQALFKEVKYDNFGKGVIRDGSTSRVSYESYYKAKEAPSYSWGKPNLRLGKDELTFANKADAENILGLLVDRTVERGMATVEDVCDILHIRSYYTDARYGWTTLRDASISQTSRGWFIDLPNPRIL